MKKKTRKEREREASERLAQYVAAQDVTAIRARFARHCAERDGSRAAGDASRSATVQTPCNHGTLPTRKAWREKQAVIPANVAAFWAK